MQLFLLLILWTANCLAQSELQFANIGDCGHMSFDCETEKVKNAITAFLIE